MSDTNKSEIESVIGYDPPNDGREWDCQCARCGSSLIWENCDSCGGDGITAPGELHEQDPLWYDPDDYHECFTCGGESAWPVCLSDPEWCEAHPLPVRTFIKRSTPEWFVVSERDPQSKPLSCSDAAEKEPEQGPAPVIGRAFGSPKQIGVAETDQAASRSPNGAEGRPQASEASVWVNEKISDGAN